MDKGASFFAKERVKRLLVPLIFGILVIVPPQVYLERYAPMTFRGSFFEFLPLSILEIALDPKGIGRRDFGGWNLFIYFVLLLLGFIIATDRRNRDTIEKSRYISLTVVLITYLMLLFMDGRVGYILFGFVRGLNSWSCIIALLGFGSRNLNFSNNFLKYANEALMPFYILHQTVIIIVGYFIVIKSPLGDVFKYFAVFIVSFMIIMALYHFVVRKYNVLRFLFGTKAKPRVHILKTI